MHKINCGRRPVLVFGVIVPAVVLFAAVGSLSAQQPFGLVELGTFRHSNSFDVNAAEITAFDPATQRLFVVNSENSELENGLPSVVDVLDISNPSSIGELGTLSIGGELTSVAVRNNVVAVTGSNGDGLPGTLSLFRADNLVPLGSTMVIGPTPDMVIFTPDGNKILIAHEGEPDYDDNDNTKNLDPEGSIGIFDLTASGGVGPTSVASLTAGHMITASFSGFNGDKASLQASGVRIFGNVDADPSSDSHKDNVTVAMDIEPEFMSISADSKTAWITLQENNALAILDLDSNTITEVVPMGLKDHSIPGQGLDASDKDDEINIANWPVKGMYLPDAIASYQVNGQTYLLLANEGDDRGEDEQVKKLDLDPTVFLDSNLWKNENIGRLSVSKADGDIDGDGLLEELHAFGGRSFSIRAADGTLIYDSGDIMEQKIAELHPDNFNANSDDPSFDDRSNKMGPQPEGITVGVVDGRTLAFVGMADHGGIMIFDVTDPGNVIYQSYFSDRDWAAEAFGDFSKSHTGPEGLLFVDAFDSPTGNPLLVVSYEVSGTTGVYEITQVPEPER